jgi:hypothetical protein
MYISAATVLSTSGKTKMLHISTLSYLGYIDNIATSAAVTVWRRGLHTQEGDPT